MKILILLSLLTCLNLYASENSLCEKQLENSSKIELKNSISILNSAVILCGANRTKINAPIDLVLSLVKGECRNEIINGESLYITCE